jgi:hypothetical protein
MLITQQSRYEVEVNDGSSGDAGDKYFIVLNERDRSQDPLNPSNTYEKAATAVDSTPGSDDSSTIASDLATSFNDTYQVASATASGSTVTIEPASRYDYLDLHVEAFTTDEQGAISPRPISAESYEIQNASNFDGSFTSLTQIPRRGLVSPSASDPVPTGSENSELRGYTRFRFDPADYSLDDSNVTFYKVAPIVDGVTQSASEIVIVLSADTLYQTHPALVLNGTVPVGSSVDDGVHLNMPHQTQSVVIKNISDPAEDIFLSFGAGEGELKLGQGDTFSDNKIGTWDVVLRTDSSAASPADVQVYATLRSHRDV